MGGGAELPQSTQYSNKASMIAMLATNLVLFFMMFSGLLRPRHESGGMLDLGRFLWRWVSWLPFFRTVVLSFRQCGTSVREGS